MNTQITCKILALTNLYSLIHNAGKRSEEDMYTKIIKYIILEMRIKVHLYFFAEIEDLQLAPKSKVYLATKPLKFTYSNSSGAYKAAVFLAS
jgi:hypothetical protein